MVKRTLVTLALLWASCGLEAPLVNFATRDKSTYLPEVADNIVIGRAPMAPKGTKVAVYAGLGAEMSEASGTVGSVGEAITVKCPDGGLCGWPDGCHGEVPRWFIKGEKVPEDAFGVRLPGAMEFRNLRLEVRFKGGQLFSIVPYVFRQPSVLAREGCFLAGGTGEATLDYYSTAATLILMGKALQECKGLSALSSDLFRQVEEAVRYSSEPEVRDFVALVKRLSDLAGGEAPSTCPVGGKCGSSTPLYPFPGPLNDKATLCDLVKKDFLEVFAKDVTCEGFAEALLKALDKVQKEVTVCYARDKMRVVFLLDMRPGALDGNCSPVDFFKWAKDLPSKTVYFTGGVHKTTPICGRDGTPPACLTEAQVDEANQILGNWVPNKIKMYDDGTHGDEVANDHIYTLVLDLPYFDPALSKDGRGVRIGYKYTYGLAGQGWTGSEEWPGNQRLLEIVDVNGDHLVIRQDVFGDEASNKDKANLLKPSLGGCGVNYFENEAKEGCSHDTREREVDTDGDCVPDTWPKAPSVSPIVVDCQGA